MNKQLWLDLAELTDAWRVVPRIVLFSFGWLTIYTIDRTLLWYFHLATADRTVQDAGLVGTVITGVSGLFTWCVKFYIQSGRQWVGQPVPNIN